MNYTYNDSTGGLCFYSLDQGLTNSTTFVLAGNNFTNLISIEGVNNWTVYCNDSANNWNNSLVIFFKDAIKPQLSIIEPFNNTNYSVNISTLNYTYNDTNPGRCWYSNNSGISNSTSLSAGTNFTNVVSIEGVNNFTIYCNDSVNNLNSTFVRFLKDTINPQLSIIEPFNNTNYSVNISTLNYSYTDDNPG